MEKGLAEKSPPKHKSKIDEAMRQRRGDIAFDTMRVDGIISTDKCELDRVQWTDM